MSIKWSSYIWDKTDYRDGSAVVALALADFANEEGTCYPKIETVAKKSRLSVRQVQRIIKAFETDGFLEVVRRYGRGKEPVFQLKMVTSMTPFDDRKKVSSVTVKGDNCDTKKVTFVASPIDKEEPLKEPIKNQVENRTQLPSERKPEFTTASDQVSSTEFSSPAVAAVAEIFKITPSIPCQEVVEAESIQNLSIWRQMLTARKGGMTDSQFSTASYVQKAVGFALEDYRREIKKQPINQNGFIDHSKSVKKWNH